jgi:hypothetical protein
MDRLQPGQRLEVDGQLMSANGRARLVMQGDGNLVLYRTDDDHALWASGTDGKPVAYTIMQGDGNLVSYSAEGDYYWDSATDGHPGAWLILQNDGNLVIYDANHNWLWDSDTVQHFGPAAVPGFKPSTTAPLFHNGPWPAGASTRISLPGLPDVNIDITDMGLCGGMSFLARDIFESGTPQLRGRQSDQVPPSVVQHILARLVDSFHGAVGAARWISANKALDHDTVVWGKGLFHQSYDEVWGIISDIDNGILSPIGLVLVHSYVPWDVFKKHVVLVYGY